MKWFNYCVKSSLTIITNLIVAKMKNSASVGSFKNVKPVMVFCYLCGRQFGSKSFGIHIKTCELKFHNQQQQKINEKQRIPIPQSPSLLQTILTCNYDSSTLKTYNDDAYQIYKYKVLPKCQYCSRTFNYESLKVHEKGCSKKPKDKTYFDEFFEEKEMIRPKALLCCVCGRQYGTKSLKIHYPQCLQKFKNDEFMRCPNPKDRRKAPQFTPEQIELFNTKQQWNSDEIEQFYKMAMGRYRNESMMECYNCKRKFIPESLDKHMKNCILINGNLNPEAHLKKVQSEKVLHFYEKNIKKPKTLMCYICGRQFGLTSLSIHQKSCFQKFKIEQQNKPKNQRKKIPQLPSEILEGNFNILAAQTWQTEKIDKYNEVISNFYNKKTLVQCYICERTFFEQSLPKHLVHCENTLEKLKFKRNRSCEQLEIVKRCQSIQKLKKIQKSIEKDIVKPRVLMCHICGREFGTTSLQIHLKACVQKFKNQQLQKDKQQQKPLPQLPTQLRGEQYDLKNASEWNNEKISYYNKTVFDIYNKKSLQMCYLCQRTFFEESLAKHMKFCQKYTLEKLQRTPSLNEKQMRALARHKQLLKEKELKQKQYFQKVQKTQPKSLACHICGRMYGLTSLQIHIPSCIKKFIDFENKKPVNQRKKLPCLQNQLKMEDYDISTAQTWSREKVQFYNQVCLRIFNHKSLTKCEYCQRTFFDEQIKKHLVFCQKQFLKNSSKMQELDSNHKKQTPTLRKCQSLKDCELSSHSSKANEDLSQPKVLFCHICGREFGLFSLKIHLPQCKQKFLKQEQLKPEKQRKKIPELSLSVKEEKQNSQVFQFDINQAESWSSQKIKRYNELCRQVYIKKSLYICKHCGRSFKEEQLPKHVKFCQKDPFKKVKKLQNSQNTENEENIKQEYFATNIIPSPQKKVKIDVKANQSDYFDLKNMGMSIIVEQDFDNSISPQNKNFKQDSFLIKSQSEFKISPLQISTFCVDDSVKSKDSKIQKKENRAPQKQKQTNKQLKNQSLRKSYSGVKGFRRSMSSNLEVIEGLGKPQKIQVQKQQKQCQYCRKRVKADLYQRHIHMCKSNSSMTGYLRKDPPKLKV